MELPRVNPGLGEIQTKNSFHQLQITTFFFFLDRIQITTLNLHGVREAILNLYYILVWIIKKIFSFWLSHDYCACSKEKVQES